MNRNSLIATILATCPDKLLETTTPNKTAITYLPIFKSPHDGAMIGITLNGFWGVNHSHMQELHHEKQAHLFYTLLYTSLNEVIQRIKVGLNTTKLPQPVIYTFPFDDLLLSAIKGSAHWRNLALTWVEAGYPLNDEMRLVLCNHDKQSKQWLRWQKKRLHKILAL